MKRMIAILLAVLIFVFALAACGRRAGSTVSESTNGTITESRTDKEATDSNRTTTDRPVTPESKNNVTDENGGLVDDMMDAAENAGDAISDAGRAVGDAITGKNDTSGAGMTGGR